MLYLLYDALDQLRKMTLSFSELRYLAVEHTEAEIRAAVEALLPPLEAPAPLQQPLIVQIPNLAGLPIYRITPYGRDLVQQQRGQARGDGLPLIPYPRCGALIAIHSTDAHGHERRLSQLSYSPLPGGKRGGEECS